MQRVLLCSSTGYLGSHICGHLRNSGFQVKTLSRNKSKTDYTWDDLNANKIQEPFDAVIDMSGKSILSSDYKELYNSRVGACKQIVNWIGGLPQHLVPKLWVAPSGVGIYGFSRNMGQIFTEKSEVQKVRDPAERMKILMADWEQSQILENSTSPSSSKSSEKDKHSEITQVTLRIGPVIGPGSAFFESLYKPATYGFATIVGNGNQIIPWIHVHDVCRAVEHLLLLSKSQHEESSKRDTPKKNKRSENVKTNKTSNIDNAETDKTNNSETEEPTIERVYNLVSPTAYTTSYREIVESIVDNMPNKKAQFFVGNRNIERFVGITTQLVLPAVIGSESSEMILKSQLVLPDALKNSNFSFSHPDIDSAIKSTIDEMS